MRLQSIRAYQLEAAMPAPQGNASGFFGTRNALLVQLVGEHGLAGWGETWLGPAEAGAMLRNAFVPRLLGQELSAWTGSFEALRQTIPDEVRGPGYAALSALDMAAWDLRGKAEGVPVATLAGGGLRDCVQAYASGPFFRPGGDPYAGYEGEIAGYLEAGFRAIKLRVGHTRTADAAVVCSARDMVGDDVALMADFNQGFDVAGACAAIAALGEIGLLWIEEPVGPDEFSGYRELASRFAVPIAGGEVLAGADAFARFVAEGRPAVLQPDLAVCGGFTEGLRIAALADAHAIAVAPHVWGTAVNLHASLHFAALLRPRQLVDGWSLPLFEYDRSPNDLRTLVPEPALAADGTVSIAEGPGIGIELHPESFAPFLIDHWECHA